VATEVKAVSDSWSGKVAELKTWFKENATNAEGRVDTDAVMARIRETVANVDRDVDAETVVAKVKETVSKAEGAVDADKLKQWIDDVDSDKLKGWVAEARARAAKLREDV
jgi:hypothetical protein